MQSIFNASFAFYFPKFSGTIYELFQRRISSARDCPRFSVDAGLATRALSCSSSLATATIFAPVHVADHHPTR
jgi:ABC-2 type transport system permease protein